MASLISANIDLTKIDKSKIYEGKKGKYYPITIVLNDELGQYGDTGYIQTEQTKEERDAKVEKVYLGNTQVVWTNGAFPEPNRQDQAQPAAATPQPKQPVDDLPF